MAFELQPHLQGQLLELRPLVSADWDELFAVASDPLIWEQHPEQDRYKEDVFRAYFKGALESGGAFVIIDRVLFGGYNGTNYRGDTWLWDGTTSRWSHVRTAHRPAPVTGPMLFPDANGRVDLFGGFDGHFYQLTMWQWTGSDWMQLSPATVPFARSSAAVATYPTIDQVVLFGGLADVNPNNTWTYNGMTWTLRSPAIQPPLVYAASAVFDPNLKTVIVFGGGSGGVDQNTTWR